MVKLINRLPVNVALTIFAMLLASYLVLALISTIGYQLHKRPANKIHLVEKK